MNGRCKEQVWNGYTAHLCSRKDWKDGFCKQHHPDSVKKRSEDAYAKFTAKMSAVADAMYQAKLAEDAALQDQQRRQSEEIARLRLENERLREALKLAFTSHGRMLMSDPPQDAWKFNRVDEVIVAALRREDV